MNDKKLKDREQIAKDMEAINKQLSEENPLDCSNEGVSIVPASTSEKVDNVRKSFFERFK